MPEPEKRAFQMQSTMIAPDEDSSAYANHNTEDSEDTDDSKEDSYSAHQEYLRAIKSNEAHLHFLKSEQEDVERELCALRGRMLQMDGSESEISEQPAIIQQPESSPHSHCVVSPGASTAMNIVPAMASQTMSIDEVAAVANAMSDPYEGVLLGKHSHLFKTFENVFTAKQARSWLQDNGFAVDSEDALRVCRELMGKGFVVPVTGDYTAPSDDQLLEFCKTEIPQLSLVLQPSVGQPPDSPAFLRALLSLMRAVHEGLVLEWLDTADPVTLQGVYPAILLWAKLNPLALSAVTSKLHEVTGENPTLRLMLVGFNLSNSDPDVMQKIAHMGRTPKAIKQEAKQRKESIPSDEKNEKNAVERADTRTGKEMGPTTGPPSVPQPSETRGKAVTHPHQAQAGSETVRGDQVATAVADTLDHTIEQPPASSTLSISSPIASAAVSMEIRMAATSPSMGRGSPARVLVPILQTPVHRAADDNGLCLCPVSWKIVLTQEEKATMDLVAKGEPSKVALAFEKEGRLLVHPFAGTRGLQVKVMKEFTTAAKPAWIRFIDPKTNNGVNPDVLAKRGDDLRKDLAVQLIFKACEAIWAAEPIVWRLGAPPCVRTYEVMVTTPLSGFLEFVPGKTVKDIEAADEWKNVNLQRFCPSAVGAMVSGFVLGVRDRHSENWMVIGDLETDPQLMQIDFGYMLMENPGGFPLDTPRLTMQASLIKLMKKAKGRGGQARLMDDFKRDLVAAYAVLRKHQHILISFCKVVLCNIYNPLQVEEFMRGQHAFHSVESEEEALDWFQDKVNSQLTEFNLRRSAKHGLVKLYYAFQKAVSEGARQVKE